MKTSRVQRSIYNPLIALSRYATGTQTTLPHPTGVPQQLVDYRETTRILPVDTSDLRPHHPAINTPFSPIDSTASDTAAVESIIQQYPAPTSSDTTHNAMKPASYPNATLHIEATFNVTFRSFMNTSKTRY